MKLLRDFFLFRALRRLLAGSRDSVRRPYAITVPAPLAPAALPQEATSNVIELHGRNAASARRVSTPVQTGVLSPSVHSVLSSSH